MLPYLLSRAIPLQC